MSDTCDVICFETREKTALAKKCGEMLAKALETQDHGIIAKYSRVPIEEIKERRYEVLHQGPDDEIREVLCLFSAPLCNLLESHVRQIKRSQIDTLPREQLLDLLSKIHLASIEALNEFDDTFMERFGDAETDPTT